MTVQPCSLSRFQKKLLWQDIELSKVFPLLKMCVSEDINNKGDITSEICQVEDSGIAALIAREEMVICGLPLIPLIIQEFQLESIIVKNFKVDGERTKKNEVFACLHGRQKDILLVERTILNFIQRLSGIATLTKQFCTILDKYEVGLLDTRKTTPGHRILEKYATSCGGSYNHRMNLSDRILIKDNHLASHGINSTMGFSRFLKKVVKKARNEVVEIEIDQIEYLVPAIEAGVDAVLLDNFSPEEVKSAVLINKNRVVLEASGGINLESLECFAETKPNFISTAAPIHSCRWIDIGLDWK